ncbi:MAG: hypothetical protein ACJAX5_003676, partial [Patiriisocius sp.]
YISVCRLVSFSLKTSKISKRIKLPIYTCSSARGFVCSNGMWAE